MNSNGFLGKKYIIFNCEYLNIHTHLTMFFEVMTMTLKEIRKNCKLTQKDLIK